MEPVGRRAPNNGDGGPIRNALHKSLTFDESVTDPAALMQHFEQCTPRQLALLRRHSCLTNADICPPDLVPDLQAQLLEKENRTMTFTRRRHEMVPDELFRQFERAAKKFKPGQVPRDILHNFTRRSHAYRDLFRWGPYETVQRIMTPVHFAIHTRAATPESVPQRGTLSELQNVMVRSYAQPCAQPCTDVVRLLEQYLNATLQQVKLRAARLLLIFEWSEAPQFDYVVCFDAPALPLGDDNDDSSMTTLGRDDLLDGLGADKSAACDLRERVRDAKLAYFFHAFVRRDDDD